MTWATKIGPSSTHVLAVERHYTHVHVICHWIVIVLFLHHAAALILNIRGLSLGAGGGGGRGNKPKKLRTIARFLCLSLNVGESRPKIYHNSVGP